MGEQLQADTSPNGRLHEQNETYSGALVTYSLMTAQSLAGRAEHKEDGGHYGVGGFRMF
jgi:hypothetical protein